MPMMMKPTGKKTREREALTPQESQLLLERVQNAKAKTFLMIAPHTGMRRGEIVALRREDIDRRFRADKTVEKVREALKMLA